MPFPDHVFRHAPSLKGRIVDPDVSEVRFGRERFDELDVQAKEEGWPPGWRMDHDVREQNRQAVLNGRFGSDLWVFAYGSLIWDPGVYVAEYRRARLDGWHRSFCMKLEGGRGSHARPGLMAALDTGGTCEGLVLRIAAELVDTETRFLWNREMFAGAYTPLFLPVATPQGPVEALVFAMNHDNPRYIPEMDRAIAAGMIAHAEGTLGRNMDYLEALVRHLHELGVSDPDIQALYDVAAGLLRDGAPPAT
ncbi:MAG: gamma-glutamylcyclotransferase [Pseudomonadota bacterium]